jgi:hypothetical protein
MTVLRLFQHVAIPLATSHSNSSRRADVRSSSATSFIIFFKFTIRTGTFRKMQIPEAARASRRQVLEQCASAEALMLPCHVGSPFAGYIDFGKAGFEPRF